MAELEAPETVLTDVQPPTRPDVFVSYAREDADFVRRLTAALAERDKSAWVDWQDIPPTAEWLAEVYAGIEAADAFVAVISPDSLASDVCALELEHAIEHNKRFVPLLYREPRDEHKVPPGLEKPNWIFIRAEDDFDSAVQTLITALDTDLDWVRNHTRLLTRAIEWQGRREDRSLLLSGGDLRQAEGWLAQHDGKKEPAPTALQRKYLLASRRNVARRQRILLIAVLIALAATAALAVLALLQRNEAVEQAETAESRALAASAVAQLPADPELSVLLAAEAAKTARTTEAEAALRLALPQSLVLAASDAHDESINTVEFSNDGRYVLSAAEDGVAVVWDWQAGKEVGNLRVVPPPGSERGAPTTEDRLVARFSPNGSGVLAAGLDKALLWRWQSNVTTPLEGHVPYKLATFASDDYLVAPVDPLEVGVANRQQITAIGLADGAGSPVVVTEIDMFRPEYAAFEPETGLFLLADLGGKVAIWDSEAARVTRLNTLPAAAPAGADGVPLAYDVELSGDGRHLAVAPSDGAAKVWDWRSGRRVVEVGGHSSTVSSVAFSPDGDLLLTASWDGTARVWNWRQRQEIAALRGHRGWVTSAAFSPNGRYVVTGGADGTVRVWAIAPERSLVSLRAGESELTSVDADEKGRWILTATLDYDTGEATRVVAVWDREQAEVAAELRWPPAPFGDYALPIEAAFSRDGSGVVATDGSSVWVWNWRKTAEASPPLAEPGKELTPVATVEGSATQGAFSPDGSLVAVAFADGFTRVWRWREQELVAELALEGARKGELPRLPQQSVAFSSDGRYLVVAGKDDRAWLWDWEERVAHELRAGGSVRTAVFSPDGRLAATAGVDGVVRVYDWRRDRLVADLRHGDGVNEVEFSPNGKLLLSGSRDGTARIWDWEAERSVLELPDHPSWVTAVAFTAGGRMIVTGGADGVARVFTCSVCGPLEALEALVPERVTRELTPEERARYLP